MRNPLFHITAALIVLAAAAGCDEKPGMTQDMSMASLDGPLLGCVTSAKTTYNASTKIVTGESKVSCMVPADLSVHLCLYSKAIDSLDWGLPLVCKDASASSQTLLQLTVQVAVGVGSPLDYRCVAEGRFSGTDSATAESAPLRAP